MAFARWSASNIQGLCKKGEKCLKKDGHKGKCWPEDKKRTAANK